MCPFMSCPGDLYPMLLSVWGCPRLLIIVIDLCDSPPISAARNLRQDMGLGWPTDMQSCLGSGTELGPNFPGLGGRLDMEQL